MSDEVIDLSLLDKMGKFIRLLASDKDGEVLASVRAMGRVLETNKLSFNSLADLLKSDIAHDIHESGYEEGEVAGFKRGHKKGYEDGYQDGLKDRSSSTRHTRQSRPHNNVSWKEMARFCYLHFDELWNDWERSFIGNVRFLTEISERQETKLRVIYERLRQRKD
jgi:hypothetical protein